ncbi:MAG TPA: extensin family protein [Bauldia sp.]|nr:extensin family protein [Bauldia sp.]
MRQVDSMPFAVKMSRVDGRGACGINKPLKISAFADGSIALGADATLGCPITMAVDGWLREAVQPAAIAWFGSPVVAIRQISDYSCRPRNNIHGARLSEHAFGNALDVAGFVFEDGTEVLVKTGWRGTPAEQGFLREVEALACQRFTTVLGPGARYHSDHFHVDLARHGKSGTYAYCNPKPLVVPPVRPPYVPGQIATPVDPATLPAYTGSIAGAGSD